MLTPRKSFEGLLCYLVFRMNLQLRRCYYNFTGCCLDSHKDPFEGCACEKVDLYHTKTFEKTHKMIIQ